VDIPSDWERNQNPRVEGDHLSLSDVTELDLHRRKDRIGEKESATGINEGPNGTCNGYNGDFLRYRGGR
jgi:hypothetical protein